MTHIILASQSPRRKQLLAAMGVTFDTIPSNFDEYLDDDRDPEVVANELALGKALDVAKRYPDAIVIGSDTIVTINGRQLDKPQSRSDALDMLRDVTQAPNHVTTGVAVVSGAKNIRLTKAATATVLFRGYDEAGIRAYVATDDPLDKAGGYAVQHPLVQPMIQRIEGRNDIIIGFPTDIVASLLAQCGVTTQPLTEATVATIIR